MDAIHGMLRQTRDEAAKIRLDVETIELSAAQYRVHRGGPLATIIATEVAGDASFGKI